MKSSKLYLLTLFALSLLLINSCKKYEDGPLLSLHTKKHRIMGTWDVEYFSINNFDSTSYLKGQPFYGMYSFGKGDLWGNPGPAGYQSETSYLSGNWRFEEKKEAIHITFNSYLSSDNRRVGPYRADDVIWDIRRLTEKELWLATSFNGKDYLVKFKLYKNY